MPLADEINYATLLPPSDGARKRVLIFFIPGNPGLVEYYRHFLDIIGSASMTAYRLLTLSTSSLERVWLDSMLALGHDKLRLQATAFLCLWTLK
jgi:hypothetical protein